MTKFETWREKQVHEKGAIQYRAEANLEKQSKAPFKECQNVDTGEIQQFRAPVADIMKLKGKYRSPKLVFSVPAIPGFNC